MSGAAMAWHDLVRYLIELCRRRLGAIDRALLRHALARRRPVALYPTRAVGLRDLVLHCPARLSRACNGRPANLLIFQDLHSIVSVLEAAALPMSYKPVPAGGIEPPHDGATTRCLPTWLSRQNLVAEAGIEPAADEAYETSALPTELFRAVAIVQSLQWLPLLGSNQALRVQSPVPYLLGEGAQRNWCHVRDSNPRHPI